MSCRWRFDPGRSAALTAPLSFGGAARQARSATRASTVGPGAFAGPGVVLSRRSSGSNGLDSVSTPPVGAGVHRAVRSRRAFPLSGGACGRGGGAARARFSVPASYLQPIIFLEGQTASSRTRLSNNRSVMPLDVLGRTRATLKESARPTPGPRGSGNPLNLLRDRDRGLQFFPVNEEFPVSASHKLALITSLPFVHTARRYYRLNDLVRSSDRCADGRLVRPSDVHRKDDQT
ncbi:hypothetical protein M8J77_018314 [Diaphorina citri]|nr:hypothetical protein M8J77_018314 [Diaphorina citri]